MTAYLKRCPDGSWRATPRAVVVAGDEMWIQWVTSGGDGQDPALVTSSYGIGTPGIRQVCNCLLAEERTAGTVVPEDLLGRVAVINVSSYIITSVSPDPQRGTADLSADPLHGAYRPAERREDVLMWQPLDLPPSARRRIGEAVQAAMAAQANKN